ncbi:carboxylating nicotinate-nucleotide diphosphorylase [Anaerosporobacter sp.]|uniref:carboxylating nicotinate-nucleotide diphosphorylase n=1 Tax=Anaerosporobacter sp. TaxID=1872529 RepID=UPI00286F760B|nr:carboxylating nicotinate-nucleotide diphosphorylase [Anaerosporobacter sp.]
MLDGVTMHINIDEYIKNALKEDITSEDVTTNSVMKEYQKGSAQLICKEDGIICGLSVFARVFDMLDSESIFETTYHDGDVMKKGELIGTITGDIRALLSGERTALNYLQRMSGIATYTNEYAKELKDYKTTLLDTRKTTPNMRPFEKYAVRVGGGSNHRYNLSDGILLKDNHIGAAGSVAKAVAMAKEYAPFVRKIEVEVENLDMVAEALEAGADIIMLDNMDNDTMKKAVEMIGDKAQTECSGNVTKERLREIAEIGVDFVSSGALTHSAPIIDLSLKNLKPIQ